MRSFLGLFLLSLTALLFTNCAPISKEGYIAEFEEFMDEAAQIYETHLPKEWAEVEKQFSKFAKEYYDKFELELSPSDKLKILGFQAKFNKYKLHRELKGVTKDAKKGINKAIDQVKDYANKDLQKDINELKKDVDKVIKEISE